MFNQSIHYCFIVILLISLISACSNSPSSLNSEAETRLLSADGSPIAYGVQGQGETTLVFIHCWTCDHHFWDAQIPYFAKNYQVVWLDLAGHGQSGSKRSDYSMMAFGEDVAAVVNHIGAKRVILIGHSMGGPVAIEAAKLLNDKIQGIVGVDTFYTPFQYPENEQQIEALIEPFKKDFKQTAQQMVNSMFSSSVDPALKASIVQKFSGEHSAMGISALYGILRWHIKSVPGDLEYFSAKLRNINGAPTDDYKPLHASVTLIPEVGHFVPQVKAAEFNNALDNIIKDFQR